MSWENFQNDAFNLTDKEVKRLARQVLAEYRTATKTINERLTKVYADQLSGKDPKKYYAHMIERDRLENLLNQINKDYSKVARKAGILTKNSIALAFSNTYYRKAFATEWLVPNARLGILPNKLIELTTLGTKKAWDEITKSIIKNFGDKINYVPQTGTLTSLLAANRNKELERLRSAITQGFINGQPKSSTMQIIRQIIGHEAMQDGSLTLTGAKSNAMRILRTETNRTANMGSYAQSKYADEHGIDIERQMQAVLDINTRAQSQSMDGQRRGVDDPFNYPKPGVTAMTPGTTGVAAYDINDRETVIDIIDGENPQIRRGRNPVPDDDGKYHNEVFAYKDYNQWAKDNGLKQDKTGRWV